MLKQTKEMYDEMEELMVDSFRQFFSVTDLLQADAEGIVMMKKCFDLYVSMKQLSLDVAKEYDESMENIKTLVNQNKELISKVYDLETQNNKIIRKLEKMEDKSE